MRKFPVVILLFGLFCWLPTPLRAAPMEVVATHSILGDLARQVGGEHVQVTTLVSPDRDPHTYEPTPADVRRIKGARVVLMNGLGLEGWMDRLVKASGFKGTPVVTTTGIVPRQMEEDGHKITDPHAWNNAANGMIYVHNIVQAFGAADPERLRSYQENGLRLIAEIEALDAETRRLMGAIPAERRKVLIGHDAFGYFADAYGLTFIAPLGLSTESEASAGDIANLIRQIRAEGIQVYFLESSNDPRVVRQIGEATGARAGGTLYVEALSDEKGPAPTYVKLFRHNIEQLRRALVP
ncbi:Periplasmic chelated iron-binding protein YfeA [Candidatus Magnetaquicoccaceae bacterium FCR-1]|uniref:Periplasmic chelated iron-binding protein YfeA n=1 Tax=Candidatus Magnetaquiglobus chichijimensis TaxID=3141448 RepID=A0ABQ0CC33_9PROT